MTTLLRKTRIGLLRLISPSITMQPAIAPIFGDLKTSRTSAIPTISSLNFGANIPVKAPFT